MSVQARHRKHMLIAALIGCIIVALALGLGLGLGLKHKTGGAGVLGVCVWLPQGSPKIVAVPTLAGCIHCKLPC